MRVGATLSGSTEVVKLLGFGTYEGDLLRPCWEAEARVYLPIWRELLETEAEKPLDDWLDWHTRHNEWYLEKKLEEALSDDQLAAAAQESLERAQERLALSDEQLIEELKQGILLNPCIQLDSGKRVWGIECWWGTEDEVRERIDAWQRAGARIETVELADDRFGAKTRSVSDET